MAVNVAAALAALLQPFVPGVSAAIQGQLLIPPERCGLGMGLTCTLPAGHRVGTVWPGGPGMAWGGHGWGDLVGPGGTQEGLGEPRGRTQDSLGGRPCSPCAGGTGM